MSLRGQPGLTPIACVTVMDWDKVHRYCRVNDVALGGDYDTPLGGAINVYMVDDWVKPEAGLHGTYYPEQSKTFGWADVFWQTGTYTNRHGLLPWETKDVFYSWAGNWSAGMAREYFCNLYERATGKPYAVSVTGLIDRAR